MRSSTWKTEEATVRIAARPAEGVGPCGHEVEEVGDLRRWREGGRDREPPTDAARRWRGGQATPRDAASHLAAPNSATPHANAAARRIRQGQAPGPGRRCPDKSVDAERHNIKFAHWSTLVKVSPTPDAAKIALEPLLAQGDPHTKHDGDQMTCSEEQLEEVRDLSV